MSSAVQIAPGSTESHEQGCGVCGAPTGDSERLCRAHSADLAADLSAVEDYLAAELDVTRTRQSRTVADRHGGRSAERPLPWNEHASVVASYLNTTLNAWALDVSRIGEDERDPLAGHDYTDTVAVAGWLRRNLSTLRRHPDAGQAHEDLVHAVARARRAIDRPAEKVFAGPCNAEIDGQVCNEDLYGRPGQPVVACRSCGARHDMVKRREWMLAVVEDEVAYSGLLAGLVTSLGVPVGSSTIRRYAATGRIKVISVDAKRRPLYRIGDVLDVLLRRHATTTADSA